MKDLARKRYSVRKYETKPVKEDKLEKILESSRVAPDFTGLVGGRTLNFQLE